MKLIEAVVQLRPRALWRTLLQPDRRLRHAMRWYTEVGRRVWPHEVLGFLFRDRRVTDGPTVRALWGEPQEAEERAMVTLRRRGPAPSSSRSSSPSSALPVAPR